ncbi:MAG: hypothetical protein LBK99_15660, partial [Opitutaceae bacterium]|nr:hypothetical protein [Opitutaceae bacterium]
GGSPPPRNPPPGPARPPPPRLPGGGGGGRRASEGQYTQRRQPVREKRPDLFGLTPRHSRKLLAGYVAWPV